VKLPWVAVNSSAILAVAHDGDSLHIQFMGGSVTQFYHVPKSLYDEMLKSPSVGQYFNARIRGNFDDSRGGVAGAGTKAGKGSPPKRDPNAGFRALEAHRRLNEERRRRGLPPLPRR
jgi:hypothetical protein